MDRTFDSLHDRLHFKIQMQEGGYWAGGVGDPTRSTDTLSEQYYETRRKYRMDGADK